MTWKKGSIHLDDCAHAKVEAQMPMIISASRSTDIPAFYADWFVGRLEAGYVKWFNPFNGAPLYVSMKEAHLFVFWSKNPQPMLAKLPGRDASPLDMLDARRSNYYFQFTLNDYDAERIEPRVPPLAQRIETFKRLSERIGPDRVVWRFDPLILSDILTVEKVLDKVERLGDQLAPYVRRLVFSFIDIASYKKVGANLERGGIAAREFRLDEMEAIASRIGNLAKGWGIATGTCGEVMNFAQYGVERNRCIDDRLIAKCFSHDHELMKFIGAQWVEPNLFGETQRERDGYWTVDETSYKKHKDKGQREACGCIMSKDIGEYNTCPHLCHYCYANANNAVAMRNWKQHLACPCSETITGRNS